MPWTDGGPERHAGDHSVRGEAGRPDHASDHAPDHAHDPWGQMAPNRARNGRATLSDRLERWFPRGPGGPRALALSGLALVALWGLSGFYRVQPDQQGVVLRFGAFSRTTQPGLHYHLPWPVETVLRPAVTRIVRTEIGFDSQTDADDTGAATPQDVNAESLMLTGDENIVDVNCAVFWRIRDVGRYLFTVRHPAATVKSAAESVLREVIGRTPIEPALTAARARIEQDVMTGAQAILDSYGAGVEITQVQLQKVDPPEAVVESFRDVQRATTDAERMHNEAQAYANDIVPRARGEAAHVVARAQGQRQAAIAEARGQAGQFLSVLQAYQTARDITLRRLYIETMQAVMHTAHVTVLDKNGGAMPLLTLGMANPSPPASAPTPTPAGGRDIRVSP